jgi:hypothetical protein
MKRVKRWRAPALLAIAALAVTSCSSTGPTVVGSGNAQTDQRTVADFTRLSVSEAIKATVIVGPDVSVTVTTDDNVLANVSTNVLAGKLTVEMNGSVMPRTPVSVAITVPNLEDVEVQSAANVTVTGVNTGSFTASAESASTLVVRGNADTVDVTANSAASADLGDVPAQNATVKASSAGRVTVNAQISVGGSVESGGSVHVEGNPPSVNVTTTSGGAVIRD